MQVTILFFDFGSGEIFLIVLAIFLVFGPGKIPELARGLGKFINEIKRASEDVKTEINKEVNRIEREKKLEKYKNEVDQDLDNTKDHEQDAEDVDHKEDDKNPQSSQSDETSQPGENHTETINIKPADNTISTKS